MSSTMQLTIDVMAVDAASSVMSSIGRAISGISGPAGVAVGALAAIGTAAVAMTASSVRAASQFQAGMTSLVTGAGEAQSNIKLVSDGILKMAGDQGHRRSSSRRACISSRAAGNTGRRACRSSRRRRKARRLAMRIWVSLRTH